MGMTMREKLARAIHAEHNRRYQPVDIENDAAHWLGYADAVLSTLREPDAAMIEAGEMAQAALSTNEPAAEIFTAMIAAAGRE